MQSMRLGLRVKNKTVFNLFAIHILGLSMAVYTSKYHIYLNNIKYQVYLNNIEVLRLSKEY